MRGGGSSAPAVVLRIVSVNDVYSLANLPKLKTLLTEMAAKGEPADCVALAGDFVSPSTLSSLDSGAAMVDTLLGVGVTHVCFGNHEADLKLPTLEQRVDEFVAGGGVWLNSNIDDFPSTRTTKCATLRSRCGRARVGLLGVISDEDGMFRDGTFKGLEISPVAPAVRSLAQRLDEIDALVCLTHQSIENDVELVDAYSNYVVAADVKADAGTEGLAQRLAPLALIIGGHEHEPMLLQGSSSQPGGDGAIDDYYFEGELAGPGDVSSGGIEKEEVSSMGKMSSGNVDATATAIVKTGSDAVRAAVATLTFRAVAADDAPLSLESVDVAFTELAEFAPDAALESRVKQHMQLVESLASSVFVDVRRKVESLDPRQRQTSLGALVASSIRDETGADIAVLNGASLKGDAVYPDGRLTLADLRAELPFPTKIVTVQMPGSVLQAALRWSRTMPLEATSRRGYLQCDDGIEFDTRPWAEEEHTITKIKWRREKFELRRIYSVALPRNLLAGFCEIEPLVSWATDVKAAVKAMSAAAAAAAAAEGFSSEFGGGDGALVGHVAVNEEVDPEAWYFEGELAEDSNVVARRSSEFGGNVEMNNDGEEEEGPEAWYFEGELAGDGNGVFSPLKVSNRFDGEYSMTTKSKSKKTMTTELKKIRYHHPASLLRALPAKDDYVPAQDYVIRHFAKRMWSRLPEFDELDRDGDGFLDRTEVAIAIERETGEAVQPVALDHWFNSLDTDNNGKITRKEWEIVKRRGR